MVNNYGLIVGITKRHGLHVRVLVGAKQFFWSVYRFWKVSFSVHPQQYPIVFTHEDVRRATRKWD